MNELNSKSSLRIKTVPLGFTSSANENLGRQALQQGGKEFPVDSDNERDATEEKLEEALELLREQASRAGIELAFKREEDIFGEVVTLIDVAENRVIRRLPVAELLQQMDRQTRQSPQSEGNGLIINGIA